MSPLAADSGLTTRLQGIVGREGVISTAKPGTIFVDMTTSSPQLAIEIHQACQAKEMHSVDAPVSGGDIGAREARLSIMIGGDQSVVESLQPVWELLGKTWVFQGPAGSGQHTKMVNQTLIATGMIGVCEALLYGHRAGLDLHTVLQSVSSGAAGSWSLSNLATMLRLNLFTYRDLMKWLHDPFGFPPLKMSRGL